MTEQERLELERLKQRQEQLLASVSLLSRDIERLVQRLTKPEPVVAPVPQTTVASTVQPEPPSPPTPVTPRVTAKLPLPPVVSPQPTVGPAKLESVAAPPPPEPLQAEPAPDASSSAEGTPAPPPAAEVLPLPPRVPVPVVEKVAVAPPREPKETSFEMRLGTYWFVRIGAVLVLTGLVFFGNLAYQKLGALGKVSMLYLASGMLLGAGAWLQWKAAKESLQNYAQVLFACGLAAVYFTTYAAHHFPNLRVIGSATADGALLLGWAAFMVWISDRKKSELLSLFSVGLAYNSAVITRVGTFTLWSNLVLAAAAGFAVAWGIEGLERNATSGLLTGIGLAVLMIFTTLLAHRQSGESPVNAVRPGPAYFSLLTIVLAAVTTWFNTCASNYPLALVAEAVLLTASIYLLRIPELPLLGQTLAFLGHLFWQVNLFDHGAPSWWNPLLMIGMTLGLGHWWQKQTRLKTDDRVATVMQFVWALAMVGLIMAWLGKICGDATWLGVASLLAVGVTAYAAAMRAWMLAICAQLFLLPSLWLFYQQVGKGAEPRFVALAPVLALGLLSMSAVAWFRRRLDTPEKLSDPLLKLATVYRWVALAMSLWWVLEYIPERHHIWVLTLIGLMVFLAAGAMRNREAKVASAVFNGSAMTLFGLLSYDPSFVFLPSFLALGLVLIVLGFIYNRYQEKIRQWL